MKNWLLERVLNHTLQRLAQVLLQSQVAQCDWSWLMKIKSLGLTAAGSLLFHSLSLLCASLLSFNFYKDSFLLIGWVMSIILTIYSIRWQNTPLHSVWDGKSAKIISVAFSITFALEVSVFPVKSWDVCSKNKANKKECLQNSVRDKCNKRSACFRRDAEHFLRSVGHVACIMFCLSWNCFSLYFSFLKICLKIESLNKLYKT